MSLNLSRWKGLFVPYIVSARPYSPTGPHRLDDTISAMLWMLLLFSVIIKFLVFFFNVSVWQESCWFCQVLSEKGMLCNKWRPHKKAFWPLNRLPFTSMFCHSTNLVSNFWHVCCYRKSSLTSHHWCKELLQMLMLKVKKTLLKVKKTRLKQTAGINNTFEKVTAWSRCRFGVTDVFESKVFSLILCYFNGTFVTTVSSREPCDFANPSEHL